MGEYNRGEMSLVTRHSSPVPPLVLTLDIGSSSVRATVFDARAHALFDASARIPYEFRTTLAGGAEMDADELCTHCIRAIDDILARSGDHARKIAAVAGACFAMSILGVDADGNAVTPIYTYADTRGARAVAELRAKFDERATQQRVGAVFHTSYLPARLLWLARERADEFKRARYWMSFGEYLYFKLLGIRNVSPSIASWTGLLNRVTLDWDDELLSALPLSREHLAPITNYELRNTPYALRAEYASRWHALKDAQWLLAVGDGAAANVGSGCFDSSRIAVTIGTSSAMRVARRVDMETRGHGDAAKTLSPAPLLPRPPTQLPFGLWSYRIDRDTELIGGALNEGGNLIAWMNRVLRVNAQEGDHAGRPYADIGDELAAMPPDAHGLTILPFLTGERAPNWNADARAAIIGLNLNTRAIDILRAGMEAVAYRLALVHALLRGLAPDAREVVASGGALQNSPAWLQIIADVLGAPLVECAEREATSRGVALLALKALGVIQSFAELSAARGAGYEPDAARHAVYRGGMERQVGLYGRIVRNA